MDNIDLNKTVIMIICKDNIIISKQDENKYHHYRHYQELYKTNKEFQRDMLGFDLSDVKINGNKKADIAMEILVSQGNIVFENGNTIEQEKNNNSILYLPTELNAFQISVIQRLIPQFKDLHYLFVERQTIDGRQNLNARFNKDGYIILKNIVNNYLEEVNFIKRTK